jgi:hypothetical protein
VNPQTAICVEIHNGNVRRSDAGATTMGQFPYVNNPDSAPGMPSRCKGFAASVDNGPVVALRIFCWQSDAGTSAASQP